MLKLHISFVCLLGFIVCGSQLLVASTQSTATPIQRSNRSKTKITPAEAQASLPKNLKFLQKKVAALQQHVQILLQLQQTGELTATAEYQNAAQINRLIKDIWHYLKPAQSAARILHAPTQKVLGELEYTIRRISSLTLTASKDHPRMIVRPVVNQKIAPLSALEQLAQINSSYLERLPELA